MGSSFDFGISCIDGGSAFFPVLGGVLVARVFSEDGGFSPETGVPVVERTADRCDGADTLGGAGGLTEGAGGFSDGDKVVFCNSVSRTNVPPGPSPTSMRPNSLVDFNEAHPERLAKSPATPSAAQATAHMDFTIPPFQASCLKQ